VCAAFKGDDVTGAPSEMGHNTNQRGKLCDNMYIEWPEIIKYRF